MSYHVGETVQLISDVNATPANGLSRNSGMLTVGDTGVIEELDLQYREPCVMINNAWYPVLDLAYVTQIADKNPKPDSEGNIYIEDLAPIFGDEDEELLAAVDDFDDHEFGVDSFEFDDEEGDEYQGADDDDGETNLLAWQVAALKLGIGQTTVGPVEPTHKYVITGDSVTITTPDGTHTEIITFDHEHFGKVRQMVLEKRFTEALAVMCPATGIESWGTGALSIEDGNVIYNTAIGDVKLSGKLIDRIIGMMSQGDKGFERLAMFLNGVMEQTSRKTQERLMEFAAHDKLDLDDKGRVIAFKNVRNDFMDKHSGKFNNAVGNILTMRREDVDDDHDHSCSAGLHVCSPTYLQSFWGTSGRTMLVVVEPRDFVAIPYDYNDSKARVCRYEVIKDVTDNISDYLTQE